MEKKKDIHSQGFASVIPIIIFVCVFLGAGAACAGLRAMRSPSRSSRQGMAGYIALMSAFFIVRGKFSDKFNWMLKGIAKPNIVVPIIVFALAGGFATVAKACGGVDSIVGLCMNYVPVSIITAGFFVVGCIVFLCQRQLGQHHRGPGAHCSLDRDRGQHLPARHDRRRHGRGHVRQQH